MRASFAGNTNYDPTSDVKTIVIDKAAASIVITWATPQTYNSSTHPASAVVNGVGGDTNLSPAATLEYFAGSTAGLAGTGSATAPTNAGTYTVRASFAGNTNYDPTSDVKTIVIDKASASIVITWATPQTYNSSTHPASAVVNGVGGDTNLSPAATLEYFAGSTAGLAGTGSATAPTNAGTYTVRASFAGNTDYDPTSDVKTIVIDKASASIVITWATPQTYNSSTHPASAVVNGVGGDTNLSPAATLEYFAGSTAGLAGTGSATAPTNAGTYTVRASFAGNTNYDPTSDVKTIVIDKASASIVITWATPQTYNSSTHPASAVVNGVGGDTNLSPVATLEYFAGSTAGLAGTGSATAPTNAGTYTVRASFAGNTNYDPTSDVKTIVIDKAAASIVITWATPQTYNSSTHPASAVVNGVGGDTNLSPAATPSTLPARPRAWPAPARRPRRPTPALTRCGPPFAGNTNYDPTSDVKTIVIDKASASTSITWATPQTYNSSTHPASAVVNGVGGDTNLSPAATLEYFAGSTAGLAGTGSATAPTNAGTDTARAPLPATPTTTRPRT